MSTHATLAPSSAERWMHCGGALALEVDAPDASSVYANEGTAAHELAAAALEGHLALPGLETYTASNGVTLDAGAIEHVARYVSTVALLADGRPLFIERRVDMSATVPGCYGTADAIIVDGTELQVHDLKFGMKPVAAEANPQLMLYGVGALAMAEVILAADVQTVRLVIHQPRLGVVSEHVLTRAELMEFASQAATDARVASSYVEQTAGLDFDERAEYLTNAGALAPSENACRWCKVKASCPALAAFVRKNVGHETPLETLAHAMQAVEVIEQWAKAVRAEAERRLLAGQPVDGFKLVQGRRGSRTWGDEVAVEAAIKALRLPWDVVYTKKLNGVPALEKHLKQRPRTWAKLAAHISQTDGRPTVAPAHDKRAALVIGGTVSDFQPINEEG